MVVMVPPLGSDPYGARSRVPLPGTFQPGGPPETEGQGVCVGVTGGQKLRALAVNPPGGLPEVKVKTPVHVAVPLIGIAMAGTESATNAPHIKIGINSFFRFVTFRILRRLENERFSDHSRCNGFRILANSRTCPYLN
jgi:hypothetical protein